MTKKQIIPKVSIVAIGNELVFGKIIDTNTQYISNLLYNCGFQLINLSCVRDDLLEIKEVLLRESLRSDIIITTGGLGPTADDLTRNAIADMNGSKLVENQPAKEKLIALLTRRKRNINENNLRQILFPEGSSILNNSIGTADGFITTLKNNSIIASFPGVPRELKVIFQDEFIPRLKKLNLYPSNPPVTENFRCFGMAEAVIGEKIESCNFSDEIEIAYRPTLPDILISFTHRGNIDNSAKLVELNSYIDKAIAAIGKEYVYTKDINETYPMLISKLFKEKKLTLSSAESCSGGLFAEQLISIPGASEFFLSSAVTYSNDTKINLLKVKSETISKFGAVSKETAKEMAEGIRNITKSDIAISITGIAGPDGGSDEKPVGTFWIGLSDKNHSEAFHYFYLTERNIFRSFTTYAAYSVLKKHLYRTEKIS
ncbi:MAG: CinA family nicotinamide mononucleotide deamidase-related protein [Proteobacteria bacterium]|nr:CinA family nicotinamide mononucleotide deamidase-related protein [Pseudomonadota bacterium]